MNSAAELIAIFAPIGRDGELLVALAERHGFAARAFRAWTDFCAQLAAAAGGAVITEEALRETGVKELVNVIDNQPDWSDLPFVVIASRADAEERARMTIEVSRPLRNVTIVERPVRPSNIVSAFEMLLRDRRRQYAVKDLIEAAEASQEALRISERQLKEALKEQSLLSQELERRVAERTLELKRANEEMEGFNYNVSHDLRAPLRAVAATSRILKEDFGELLPKAAHEQLDRQISASMKLGNLIDDLLQLSRLSRQQMRTLPINLSAMAEEVVDDLSRFNGKHKVEYRIQPNIEVDADPTLLRLALTNLLENAAKFSPAGGTIEMGTELCDGDKVVFIRDHGIGFDMRYNEKIFLPFERLVTDREFPGTGVGLANVKRIINRHGGRIWVDSKQGEGTTFYFSL